METETAAAVADITKDIASSDVIMWEVIVYFVASLLILFIMDWYASFKIGGKTRPGYIALKGHRGIAVMIMAAFTVIIGMLCLMTDFTCSRGTLTSFGLPYLVALVYYMVKMFRRVRAETKGRRL